MWIDIVNRMPPAWFLTALPMLEAYARGVAFERELAAMLSTVAIGSKAHGELGPSWRAQTSLIASLATKLKLSPRSQHDRKTSPKPLPIRRPWENKPREPAE